MPLHFTVVEQIGAFDCSPAAIERRLQDAADPNYRLTPARKTFAAIDENGIENFRISIAEEDKGNGYPAIQRWFSTRLTIIQTNPNQELAKSQHTNFLTELKNFDLYKKFTGEYFDYSNHEAGPPYKYEISLSNLYEMDLEMFWNFLQRRIFSFDGGEAVLAELKLLTYPKFFGDPLYTQIKSLIGNGDYQQALTVAKAEDWKHRHGGMGASYTYAVGSLLFGHYDDAARYTAMLAFAIVRSKYSIWRTYDASDKCMAIAIALSHNQFDSMRYSEINRPNGLYAVKACLFSYDHLVAASGERLALLSIVNGLAGNRADVEEDLFTLQNAELVDKKMDEDENDGQENLTIQIIDKLTSALKRDAETGKVGKTRTPKRRNSF